jgi:glycine dehydrogenase subunit 2
VQRDGDRFRLVETRDGSIGRMHGFHGNVGILVRAYVYVALHGADGLRRVSDLAVINANYLAALLRDTLPLAYPDERPMHEFVASVTELQRATGIRAMDIAKRLIDLGFHPPTVYFPLVVDEAMMVEPTETESKETLDAFATALEQAVAEAHTDPQRLRAAPVTTPVGRLDEARAARHLRLRWTAPQDLP